MTFRVSVYKIHCIVLPKLADKGPRFVLDSTVVRSVFELADNYW
jgi:hypothetical protein